MRHQDARKKIVSFSMTLNDFNDAKWHTRSAVFYLFMLSFVVRGWVCTNLAKINRTCEIEKVMSLVTCSNENGTHSNANTRCMFSDAVSTTRTSMCSMVN